MTAENVLVFHYTTSNGNSKAAPRCQAEFLDVFSANLGAYLLLGAGYGTLGLITLNDDVFVCVVTGAFQAASVSPGETVRLITRPFQVS